jgi:hypothetical protein
MNKVLFVAYGGGHIASCLPVADLLRRQGYLVDLLALTTARDYAEARNWQPLGFKDFLLPNDLEALKVGEQLMSKEASGLVTQEESKAYLGLNYLDLVAKLGAAQAASVYNQKGRQAFLPVRTLKRILGFLKPALLVTTCAPRSEYAALIASAELGIPSVCLLDLPDAHMVERVASAPGVRAICVSSDISRQMLLQRGVESSIIYVTGNPAFDELRDVDGVRVDLYRKTLSAADDSKILVWASQPEPEIHPVNGKLADAMLPAKIETILREWVQSRENVRLVIRYHPNENKNFSYQKNVYLSKRGDDLRILLNACDGLITMTSTVGLQASALGKPVISVDLSVFTDDMPLSKLGFSRGVPNLNMIPKALDEWVDYSKDSIRSSHESINASESVCKVISGLL